MVSVVIYIQNFQELYQTTPPPCLSLLLFYSQIQTHNQNQKTYPIQTLYPPKHRNFLQI
ncbi:hypothetical protein BPUTSESOX_2350 [uncultured Gammaproteobacteria bacterium]|nr:hypothetical protein [uncultured Gammaproteobacteria bacterium]VVH51338.1 hypothetical protein BPUTSESOX_2350 [uncultured Gammaproteobacteria bacterium]